MCTKQHTSADAFVVDGRGSGEIHEPCDGMRTSRVFHKSLTNRVLDLLYTQIKLNKMWKGKTFSEAVNQC